MLIDFLPGVSHVGSIVDGGSAIIPGHSVADNRDEGFLLSGETVPQLQSFELPAVFGRGPGGLLALREGHGASQQRVGVILGQRQTVNTIRQKSRFNKLK